MPEMMGVAKRVLFSGAAEMRGNVLVHQVRDTVDLREKRSEYRVRHKRNDEQKESLQKERESYLEEKPWREMQDVEKEKKLKQKAEKDKLKVQSLRSTQRRQRMAT